MSKLASYTLTLAATPTRVSDAYGSDSLGGVIVPAADVPYKQLLLQATGADAFLGTDDTVTTSTGIKVDSTDLQPVTLGPFPDGPVKLSDLYAVGSGATLIILGVVY